ncbi:flagellin [Saccharospirillum mangrovi]|uniref:flagellin N-terminal helical domain-containing protein n=1 Tax=Saccharospirillum mangrovi TaxID=2161747 RepID=UPI000D3CA9F5|nr:flagellin [Saccharospirillum mangrovi]
MPQIINTNIASLNAQRNLNTSQDANSTALQRLSSGLRINSAKDDAAGLAISTRFESQTKGLNVAIRNAGDGISLAQTAEGALGAMTENLQRIRELAVQASNETNSESDRIALQQEVDQLIEEITRTAEETNFNGRNLLDGSFNGTFQVGANAGDVVNISISELTAGKLGASDTVGVSAVGSDQALSNGDLIINGVPIPPSKAEDDTSSFAEADTSSIAKAAAINSVSDETGVKAYVTENVAAGSEMEDGTAVSGTITLNGVEIEIQTTSSADTTRASVAEAINAFAEQTGVRAVNSGTSANGVTLVAEDGRNITVDLGTLTTAQTGLAANDTYQGGYTLVANGDVDEIVISGGDGTGGGNLANAGLTAGTYQRGAAQLASTSTSTTSGVGFQTNTVMSALGSDGIFGLSGGMFTSDLAAGMTGTSGLAVYGTVAEVITVTVGGNSAVMTYSSIDMGADTLAAAINAAGSGSVEVSAETRVDLTFAGYTSAGFATTGTIQIRDTQSTGALLGTLSIASGQTVEQLAGAINAAFTSIVATFDTTGSISLTDVDGNTLAFFATAAFGNAVTADFLSATGTVSATVADIADTNVRYGFGYIKDVDVTDGDVSQIQISSNRMADTSTANLSTFLTRGTAGVASPVNALLIDVASSTYGLENGDLLINGVSIDAADPLTDTASAKKASDGSNIQSADKTKSGIAIAAAINKVSEETGVTATVNATKVVGSDENTDANVTAAQAIYGAGDAGKIYINGVDLGVISLVDDGSGGIDLERSRQAAIDLINQKSGLTGVTAEDNGESITLIAADGRNVSVAIDNDNHNNGVADPSDTGFGALIGLDSALDGIGEADIGTAGPSNVVGDRGDTSEGVAYETTYATVTLNSAKGIDISAGTGGKDELEDLGFTVGNFGGGTDGAFLKDLDITTFEGAQEAINAIDNALDTVASQRAALGAIQNRFESTVSNLQITAENLTAANSRIRDADFAAETAELSRTQVLQQAGISILAQANQRPQQVLSLLG